MAKPNKKVSKEHWDTREPNNKPDTGAQAIDKLIADIKQGYGGLTEKIVDCATSIVKHAVEHGDGTKADVLLDAIPLYRVGRLRKWFQEYGPFYLDDDKKLKVSKKKREALAQTNYKGAELPDVFAKLAPVKAPDFNLLKALTAILNTAKNVRDKKKPGNTDGYEKLEKLVLELTPSALKQAA